MDALSLSPPAPATLGALGALRPLPPLPIQEDKTSGSSALAMQDLAQGLFQRTLQASLLSPVSEAAGGNVGLTQEASAALLASLTTPQAPVSATPSSAPTATTPAAVLTDVPAAQDAFAHSSTLEFALGAALRFGAGVAGQGTPVLPSADLSTGLIRDAAAVPRLSGLQAQAGAPGTEAFTLPQPTASQALRSYGATLPHNISAGTSGLDVFA